MCLPYCDTTNIITHNPRFSITFMATNLSNNNDFSPYDGLNNCP